jgi:hypothetical protein
MQPSSLDAYLVKYNPPKITIIYHLESNAEAKFAHDIDISITTTTNLDDLTDFIFKSEAYYLDQREVSKQ